MSDIHWSVHPNRARSACGLSTAKFDSTAHLHLATCTECLRNVAWMIKEYQTFNKGATALLAEYGWEGFGAHSGDSPSPKLEFSEQLSEDGLPLFERVIVPPAPTIHEAPEIGDK